MNAALLDIALQRLGKGEWVSHLVSFARAYENDPDVLETADQLLTTPTRPMLCRCLVGFPKPEAPISMTMGGMSTRDSAWLALGGLHGRS
jgi:hypothetical protein